jgi:hypothetical protein
MNVAEHVGEMVDQDPVPVADARDHRAPAHDREWKSSAYATTASTATCATDPNAESQRATRP